ncbi:hypothetical protein V6N11_018848 [Hibiscus sabdariffa]|uniref:Late embryogenesis abundant protein LEA-2 subgroup domain-containing protein n=1 Tax=Hibiscus sabdariffa TaxID=183260 RepID=A0ABR2N8R4_9ROSI
MSKSLSEVTSKTETIPSSNFKNFKKREHCFIGLYQYKQGANLTGEVFLAKPRAFHSFAIVNRRRQGKIMANGEPKSYSSSLQLALTILGTVTGMTILIVGITMASTYAPEPHQQPLILKIHSISVSGLNVSCFLTSTRWDISVLFANRHSVLEMSIHRFESSLYYNYSNPISCAVVEAMHLGPKKQRLVEMQFNSAQCGDEQPYVEDWVLEGIKEDEEKGEIRLVVGMKLMVSYRTGILGWDYDLKPDCPELHVELFLVLAMVESPLITLRYAYFN